MESLLKLRRWMSSLRQDNPQTLRLRRMGLALLSAVAFSGICIIFYHENLFRISFTEFMYLLLAFWLINIGFVAVILTGLNKKCADPSLTTAQMFWAISATMVTVYLAIDRRTILLMMTLLAIMFGGLQYSKTRVFNMTLYSLALYGLIIYLLKDISELNLNIRQEMIVYFVYAMILLGYNVLALEMIVTRQYLKDKSLYLQSNLHKVEIESITDSLTGIGNRRFLQKIMKVQVSMAERSQQYFFSLSMVDIDFFKQINDQYGHHMGDKVLQKMCHIINHALRQSDTFGRYGGEEFIIVSPLTDASKSVEFAERVRKLVEEETFDSSVDLKVTISIGVTVYKDAEPLEKTLKRVDEALYLAKERGRNQVVVL